MQLTFEILRDKIAGCWQGKNAGGVLGAPFECRRGLFDVTFYTQENLDRNPPPNDDLDLQIAWLNAVEEYGPCVTSEILADYWLTFITPNWSEYGIGKSNLKRGFMPPLSGQIGNYFKDSCGAFIRSEIWACLCPAQPEKAVRYAYLDASVDHADEGVYGEMFFAAVESAAFVESNAETLIDIGLSYIPSDCLVSKAVMLVRECYRGGETWQSARKKLFTEVPGAFSACFMLDKDLDNGDMARAAVGMDAPNNIGIAIIGWLYGEGDFGKSMCLCANCGEDADCSAGTVGAIIGIIKGEKALPAKWLEPIGGVINTVCLEKTSCLNIPATVDEFTDRIMAAIPKMLGGNQIDFKAENTRYAVNPAANLFADRDERPLNGGRNCSGRMFNSREIVEMPPLTQAFVFDCFKAQITLEREPFISNGETFTLRVKVTDSAVLKAQQWINADVYVSDGLAVDGGAHFSLPFHNSYRHAAENTVVIRAESLTRPDNTVLIDFNVNGRHTSGTAKIKLMSR